MFPDLKEVRFKQQPTEIYISFFPTYFIKLWVHAHQESFLVLLSSCQLHVDSQTFGCSIEFTGSTLPKLPYYVFLLLFSTDLST